MIGIYKAEKAWEPKPLYDYEIQAFKEFDYEHPFGDFTKTFTEGHN
jgi:hypothetical protein